MGGVEEEKREDEKRRKGEEEKRRKRGGNPSKGLITLKPRQRLQTLTVVS